MKKGLLKKILVVAVTGIMMFSLGACGSKSDKDGETKGENKLEEIKKNGKLVVGLSGDYAPYEFYIMDNGEKKLVGFDVDLANEVAKDLGVKLEIKDMSFDSLLSAITAEQIDMIISGMNPDPEREKVVTFSDIYYEAKHGVLINKKDAEKFKKIEDLEGVKIGAQLGSTQEKLANEKVKAINPTLLADVNNLILELKTGKIKALITEEPVAKMAIEKNPEMMLAPIEFEADGGGNSIAVKKGENELIKEANKTIKRLLDSGELEKFIINANKIAN
ncbi:transporter substrate-binding domain-containing protein [uncultured Clostridium sp.]|uniref:transporter substrate-binding domain-containing protein n=1 Tax=uncultured Clostridium sp. TaxID=59620 RepID=UPI00260191BC|nr:transporter substrate-binding domain-containing protein [uncultured Clostridium sp.]